MGSGHVLVYAFDVFMQLYIAEGFRERDAAELIMTNNLFGLEIDKRAYQLAYFAIIMKGREYNRRILSKEIKLNLHQFIDSPEIPNEYFERLAEVSQYSHEVTTTLLNQLTKLLDQFKNATEIGSILKIEELQQSELDQLNQFIGSFEIFSDMDILYQLPEIQTKVISILNITRVLMTEYTAVTTNPPYLNKMSSNLDKYVKKNYPNVKTDLFSVFIKMNSSMLTNGGYAGFMTPFVWMFIKSYEELRSFLITNKSISSLIQMEYSAFEEATVPVCCFMIKNAKTEPVGNYLKLSDFKGGMMVQKEKVLEAILKNNVEYFYRMNQMNFLKIPGKPVSFWVSENLINIFSKSIPLSNIAKPKQGIKTGDNNKFLRFWFEPSILDTCFECAESDKTVRDRFKWFKTTKGGGFRKWYGNLDFVINWENNGTEIKNFKDTNGKLRSRPQNLEYLFKPGLTWSTLSSGNVSFRLHEKGIFESKGSVLFPNESNRINTIFGFLNSGLVNILLTALTPTLDYSEGGIGKIPFISLKEDDSAIVGKIVSENIRLSKSDYDSLEYSWNFKKDKLI